MKKAKKKSLEVTFHVETPAGEVIKRKHKVATLLGFRKIANWYFLNYQYCKSFKEESKISVYLSREAFEGLSGKTITVWNGDLRTEVYGTLAKIVE